MDNKLVNAVGAVDATFLFIFGVSALLLLGIAGAMVFFVIRYNRKRHPEAAQFSGNFWAEVIWIVAPTISRCPSSSVAISISISYLSG